MFLLPLSIGEEFFLRRRACLGLHQWRGRGSGHARDGDSAVVGDRSTRTLGRHGRTAGRWPRRRARGLRAKAIADAPARALGGGWGGGSAWPAGGGGRPSPGAVSRSSTVNG